jgi:hypothetical protein
VVPTGAHLRLVFARSPEPESVTAVRWVGDRAEPVPLDPDGVLVVGSDPGALVYEVRAAWPGVEGVYAVRLEATGAAPPGDASRCRSADLELSVQGPVSEPTGQHTLPLALTSRSARTCSLLGYPTVALLDAGGRELPFVYRRGGDQVVTSRPPGRVDLAPGAAAHATVNKYRCDLGNRGAAAAITLTLPDDPSPLRLALPSDAVLLAYCGPGDPGSVVSVSPFSATLQDTLAQADRAARPATTAPTAAPCPVTTPDPDATPPAGLSPAPPPGAAMYGNGALWVALSPPGTASPDADGVLSRKFMTWRLVRGKLSMTARRLDGPAPPGEGVVPDGYGDLGFQASAVRFPTEGCWEVSAKLDDRELRFVVEVGRGSAR